MNGIQEVRGSIPLISTTNQIASAIWFFCFSGRFFFRLFAPFILRYDSYAQNGMNLSLVLPVRSFTSSAGPPLSPCSAARPISPNHINQRKKRPALCQRREPGVLNDRFAHKSAGKPCQELAGALFTRVVDDLLRRAFFHHNAVVHKHNAVRHIAGKVHLMGDDDHGGFAVGQIP